MAPLTQAPAGNSGRTVDLPAASTLSFGCGSDVARFTLYRSSLDDPVRLDKTCSSPRLVAAWPTVMGLPPGSYELEAVRVRNA